MQRDYQLEKEISDSLANYSAKLEWDVEYYDIDVTYKSNRISLRWSYPLRAIGFRFYVEEMRIFASRVSYGKDKLLADIWEKISDVILRFLNLPNRTITRGKWLKTTYLEVNENGQWVDIFYKFRSNNIKVNLPRTGIFDAVPPRAPRLDKSIDSPRNHQLEKEIINAFTLYSTNLKWDDGVYKIDIAKDVKRVNVEWAYHVNEVYFDFFENDIKIYKDWADFYEGETSSEIFNFISFLVKRYINLPCRVITHGKWLKTTDLEVYVNEEWVNIYKNISLK
jgi:hypothetical protein